MTFLGISNFQKKIDKYKEPIENINNLNCRQSTMLNSERCDFVRVVVQRFNDEGTMRFQLTGPVGIITIDRPKQRNALSQQMWVTLRTWAKDLPAKTKLLVIRGSGKDFTAGSDIKEFADLDVPGANRAFEAMEDAMQAIESLTIPTIASINGPAYGAGFVLGLACDVRIGSEIAKFGMPVGKLGITLQPPFLRRMIQTLGPSRTKDLVYTARTYSAQEAEALGVLNYLVPSVDLDMQTMLLARKMLQQSRASLRAVKQNVQRVLLGGLLPSQDWVDGEDFSEGVRAFNEKRLAHF